tara:strand:- start:40433 stop:41731 length:1299 start_codon:yes stop_codon:yes gene_type:complete
MKFKGFHIVSYLAERNIGDIGPVLIYLFAGAIYLPMIFTNIISILLVLFCVVRFGKEDFKRVFKTKFVILFLGLYSILFTGLFYNIPLEGIWNGLEKKLSFVVLPVSIGLIGIGKRDLKSILRIFYYSGILVTSYAVIVGVALWIREDNTSFLVNHGLSQNIGFHATYLSMYLLFAIAYPIIRFQDFPSRMEKYLLFFLTGLLIIYIILLAVRIVWLLFFFLLIIWLTYVFFSKGFKLKYFLGIALFSLMVLTISMMLGPVRERFKEAINFNNEYNIEKVWGGRNIRIMVWKSGISLLEKKPFSGYGSSSQVQKELNLYYKDHNLGPILYMMKKNGNAFNAHNQFLAEVLKHGLILGMLYFFILLIMVSVFWKNSRVLGILFFIIIFGVSLTETILELNKGIVFFAFFGSVLCFNFNELYSQKIEIMEEKSI